MAGKHLRRACKEKIAYRLSSAARRKARRLTDYEGLRHRVIACPWCGQFHIEQISGAWPDEGVWQAGTGFR